MPTGRIAETLANECMVGKAFAWFFLHQLATLATAELKKNGKFNVPGVVLLKTRMVAAEKAGKKEMFGKTVILKAKPRRKIVKAFPAAALKARI